MNWERSKIKMINKLFYQTCFLSYISQQHMKLATFKKKKKKAYVQKEIFILICYINSHLHILDPRF